MRKTPRCGLGQTALLRWPRRWKVFCNANSIPIDITRPSKKLVKSCQNIERKVPHEFSNQHLVRRLFRCCIVRYWIITFVKTPSSYKPPVQTPRKPTPPAAIHTGSKAASDGQREYGKRPGPDWGQIILPWIPKAQKKKYLKAADGMKLEQWIFQQLDLACETKCSCGSALYDNFCLLCNLRCQLEAAIQRRDELAAQLARAERKESSYYLL